MIGGQERESLRWRKYHGDKGEFSGAAKALQKKGAPTNGSMGAQTKCSVSSYGRENRLGRDFPAAFERQSEQTASQEQ